jgi:hypothetical protein
VRENKVEGKQKKELGFLFKQRYLEGESISGPGCAIMLQDVYGQRREVGGKSGMKGRVWMLTRCRIGESGC